MEFVKSRECETILLSDSSISTSFSSVCLVLHPAGPVLLCTNVVQNENFFCQSYKNKLQNKMTISIRQTWLSKHEKSHPFVRDSNNCQVGWKTKKRPNAQLKG